MGNSIAVPGQIFSLRVDLTVVVRVENENIKADLNNIVAEFHTRLQKLKDYEPDVQSMSYINLVELN
jgi:hypothetical protein